MARSRIAANYLRLIPDARLKLALTGRFHQPWAVIADII
jgi:hypothetical protein